MNESNHELVRNYGMPGATAVAVIRTIEEERLSEIDKSKIAILWRSKYIELSSNNTDPRDAINLALLGLQNEEKCYPLLLIDLGITAWDVYNTDQKYKIQNYGKHCF